MPPLPRGPLTGLSGDLAGNAPAVCEDVGSAERRAPQDGNGRSPRSLREEQCAEARRVRLYRGPLRSLLCGGLFRVGAGMTTPNL